MIISSRTSIDEKSSYHHEKNEEYLKLHQKEVN